MLGRGDCSRWRAIWLPDGRKLQIVIPIRRETITMGVFCWKAPRPETCPDEVMNFLTRLTDHAAIAIANAQLYEEVQRSQPGQEPFRFFRRA